jgi:biopolymer transport protein ExbD
LGLASRTLTGNWLATLAVAIALTSARAADKPAEPLTVTIEDGEVLFQGAPLDTEQLTEKLKATGRQAERVYFRIGPHATTAYGQRVVAAIKAAGFADIAVLPPPGLGKMDAEPPL